MPKHHSEDYKVSAVKHYLKLNKKVLKFNQIKITKVKHKYYIYIWLKQR